MHARSNNVNKKAGFNTYLSRNGLGKGCTAGIVLFSALFKSMLIPIMEDLRCSSLARLAISRFWVSAFLAFCSGKKERKGNKIKIDLFLG